MTWQRNCPEGSDTESAGEEFASVLTSGDIVLLSGQLGAGKTTFVKGVARGLGVEERVTSPTFTIVREHHCHNDRGITTLHHADVYRVGSIDEVTDLALGELVEESGVALVEWGDLAASLFGRDVLSVSIEVGDDDQRRIIVAGELSSTRTSALDRWERA